MCDKSIDFEHKWCDCQLTGTRTDNCNACLGTAHEVTAEGRAVLMFIARHLPRLLKEIEDKKLKDDSRNK